MNRACAEFCTTRVTRTAIRTVSGRIEALLLKGDGGGGGGGEGERQVETWKSSARVKQANEHMSALIRGPCEWELGDCCQDIETQGLKKSPVIQSYCGSKDNLPPARASLSNRLERGSDSRGTIC